MGFNELPANQKERFFRCKIFEILKESGKPMSRAEIKEALADSDDEVAQFMEMKQKSKKTGNMYSQFAFNFNFALKDLKIAGLVAGKDKIELTEKGINLNIKDFDVDRDVYALANKHWKEYREEYQKNRKQEDEGNESAIKAEDPQDAYDEELKTKLLESIAKMSPAKFEVFSRALLKAMGVEFTDKGTQISNDGGIDGFGYHRDPNDFRTTKVVIQCKRYNANNVSAPDIDGFLGAMNKNRADYGIFITNSRFTISARKAAREGTPVTLIDGDELVKLIVRYQLYLTPIQTYSLTDFYNFDEEENS